MVSSRVQHKLDFKPKLISTIATALILPILLTLSYWQYNRGISKQLLFVQLHTNLASPHILLNNNSNLIESIEERVPNTRFTRVKAIGKLLDQNFLLDNQIVNSIVGYRVITPFKLTNSQKIIFVDRGFIPRKFHLETLGVTIDSAESSLKTTGETTIYGIINRPVTGLVLKKDTILKQPHWPVLIQSVDFELLKGQLDADIYPIVIQLDKNNSNTFEYVEPNFGLSSAKHFSYAMQWFTLALTLVLYYLIVNTKVIKLN